mgnify:CR=1 FL=1
MLTKSEIHAFISYCRSNLDFSNLTKAEAYGYHNLPLCIIDAVFSIGVRYTSTENTVKHFCNYFDITRLRDEEIAIRDNQLSVSEFVQLHSEFSFQEMADKIYQNNVHSGCNPSGIEFG